MPKSVTVKHKEVFMTLDKLSQLIPFDGTSIMNVSIALLILIIGRLIAGFFRRKIRRSSLTQKTLNDTLRPVIASIVYYFILITALYAALVRIGVTPTTLLAAFGAAGLAIALALKDTLANIAAGVMLLFVRSLQVGDYVELPGTSGTIEEIGLFATILRDAQGIAVYVPNNIIWSNRVQNYNRHGARKAIININVGFDTDLQKTQTLLEELLKTIDRAQHHLGAPEVYVTDFTDLGASLSCRIWLPGDSWSAQTSDLRIKIKSALDKAGVQMQSRQTFVKAN